MNKQTKALTLALEALWTSAGPKAEEAIIKCKEALAQSEQGSLEELRQMMQIEVDRLIAAKAPQQPERPWVGLTEDERQQIRFTFYGVESIQLKTEARLKEKNA